LIGRTLSRDSARSFFIARSISFSGEVKTKLQTLEQSYIQIKKLADKLLMLQGKLQTKEKADE